MALKDLSPLGRGQNYVDFARAALQANQPILPSEHRDFSALPLGHLAGMELDLVTTIEAPHDPADLLRSGSAFGAIKNSRPLPSTW